MSKILVKMSRGIALIFNSKSKRKLLMKLLSEKSYHRLLWKMNINSEIKFWEKYFETKGLDWKDNFLERSDPELQLQDDLVNLIKDVEENEIEILDIGSGPQTYIGKRYKNKVLKIQATDPLAEDYLRIMSKHSINSLVPPQKIAAEDLLNYFYEKQFDLIVARNSLDHAFDPISALINMVKLVKINRYVYVITRQNEASNQNYHGLHQWNFKVSNNRFYINSNLEDYDIQRILKNTKIDLEIDNEKSWLYIKIKRLS